MNESTNVKCCFCGEWLLLNDASVLDVRFNIKSDETQRLFCHKHHLIERLDKSIPLHPDFFE
jgi:hypothetical protein